MNRLESIIRRQKLYMVQDSAVVFVLTSLALALSAPLL